MSQYIELLLTDFRTDHPGIVEEWERQSSEYIGEAWPDLHAPQGFAWWVRSEVELAREQRAAYPDTPEDAERERGIAEYCLAVLHDLGRVMINGANAEGREQL